MKRYEVYDSFLDIWMDEIPAHWETHKMKYLFHERSEKGYPDEPLLVASQNMGVVPKNVYGNRTVEAQKDLHLLKLVRVGDFVISLRSFQGGLEYAYYQGIISPAYTVLTPYEPITAGYFRYLAKSKLFIGLLTLCVTGIREGQNIDYEKLRNHFLPVPPRAEQDQIVRYLDWQVSKINRLIAAKRKQIAVLLEQQKHRIVDAVLRGIDDNSVLKDSGEEWIGAIPKHWNVVRCKYVFTERDERSIAGEEEHLSMSQKFGLVPDSNLDERRMLSESYAGGKICYKDDLVLNRLKAHLGVFALAPQKGVISPDYTVLVSNTERILPAYGEAVLKSDICRRELRIRVRGIIEGFWRLYTDDFNTIVIPLPPLEEQKRIMEYLSNLNEKYAALKQNLEQEITTLQELRIRMISDVVTGQVDVRGIEIPEFEYTADADPSEDEPTEDMEPEPEEA